MKRVLVLHAQIPFERGGAELLAEGLVKAINDRLDGVVAELVKLPFKWYPEEQILSDIMAWRCIDVTEAAGKPIDLVIGTKFPSYAVNHPNKVIWLVHQHRIFYDLEGTQYDKNILTADELVTRTTVKEADTKLFKESKAVFTIANTVSDRLLDYNKVQAEPVFPPSSLADKIYSGKYGDYVLCVARLDRLKRQDLLIKAASKMRSDIKIKIVGRGAPVYQKELKELVSTLGLENKIELLGFVDDKALLELLANCRAVYYGPVDEDYGYATIEGFLARKPVVTLEDSGEVARLVKEYDGGWIVSPREAEIARCLDSLHLYSGKQLEEKAERAHSHAKDVTWEKVLEKLVVPFL